MIIKVSKEIYSKEVLLKTAYSFTDKAYLHLSQDADCWIVSWTKMKDLEINPMAFENELIAQQLRYELIDKTKDIRKLLLSRAFASSVMELPAEESLDFANENKAVLFQDDIEENEAEILKGWFD